MRNVLLLFFLVPLMTYAQQASYKAHIYNDLEDKFPVRIEFSGDSDTLLVINAEETISLPIYTKKSDTLVYRFKDYNAEIGLYPKTQTRLEGYWINYESDVAKRRFVEIDFSSKEIEQTEEQPAFSGRWEAEITKGSRSYPALIQLKNQGSKMYGTIMTNAGDYRHLEGVFNPIRNTFYLSSFNGNSIFKMEGTFVGDSLIGRLFGVVTNTHTIRGVRNPHFELPDSKSLTTVSNDKDFNLDLNNEWGEPQQFKKLIENKVAIVSIFGTWCPNCIDETNYFNEIQKKFPELQIICVAFEATDDVLEQQKRIQGFKQRKNINLPFLIAGKANTQNVFKHFPMITSFGGYPTIFLLDKSGAITEIYTGFNGPATGIYYELFKEEFERKIRNLLQE